MACGMYTYHKPLREAYIFLCVVTRSIRKFLYFSDITKKLFQTSIKLMSETAFDTAGDRNRTGTMLPPQDFKSCASASSATPAFHLALLRSNTRMDGGGFEPPKQCAADLQSVPFGHSGIHPLYQYKADMFCPDKL